MRRRLTDSPLLPLDAELIEALIAVLNEEIDLQPFEDQPDLTQPPYLWEPVERFYPEAMTLEDLPHRAAFRAAWPESSFCLLWDGGKDVELEITLRLPEPGTVRAAINNNEIGAIEATERWTRTALTIDRRTLHPGLNRLTLRWPLPTTDGEAALSKAADRLTLGIAADLHPVFAEVFSLIRGDSRLRTQGPSRTGRRR
ncbi:MAG: hypothetical protein ACJ75H_09320 [Thermoanaerobaculia bacterium]